MRFCLPFFFIFLLFSQASRAQSATPDTTRLRISLLTCGPGTELYSMWGHTAIRVIDSARRQDWVFNYGTFDDSDPYFYVKFTRGIMIYALSVQSFSDFMAEYQYEGRSVTEQVLNLDPPHKLALQYALEENAKEENRFYAYHFHTDNCTTRAADMIFNHIDSAYKTQKILNGERPNYRTLIHSYLDKGGLLWSKLGIDILLGSHLDEKPDNRQLMFLPDYLMQGIDKTSNHGQPLVKRELKLLHNGQPPASAPLFSPMVVFSILLVLVALMSVYNVGPFIRLIKIFDVLFFFILGLLGLLLLTLWMIRVDDVCRNNYNLIWALPTHLPMAFLMHRKKEWIKKYFRFVFILTLLLSVTWFFIPQNLNIAVAPLLLIIITRSYFRSRY